MRKKRFLKFIAAATLVVLTAFLLWPQLTTKHHSAPATPASLFWICEHDIDGTVSDNPTFWVTNHTDRIMSITLKSIEVLSGSSWRRVYTFPFGSLYFNTTNGTTIFLGPLEAKYGNMLAQRVHLPTGVVWRVRATVSEKLTGAEDIVEAVRSTPVLWEMRHRSGNTNIPVNPFRPDISHLKRPVEIESAGTLIPPAR